MSSFSYPSPLATVLGTCAPAATTFTTLPLAMTPTTQRDPSHPAALSAAQSPASLAMLKPTSALSDGQRLRTLGDRSTHGDTLEPTSTLSELYCSEAGVGI